MANEISSADISANQTFGTAGIYRQENLKERLLEVLRDDPTAFQWLEGLNFTLNAFGLLIGFVHNYFAFWFRDHKRPIFENALGEIFAGSLPRLLYQWPDNSEMPEIPELPAPPPLELPLDTGGDPFADLVFNQKNSFAFEAARRAANTALCAEGCDYAILVLCGPSGVGKSFLLILRRNVSRHAENRRGNLLAYTSGSFAGRYAGNLVLRQLAGAPVRAD